MPRRIYKDDATTQKMVEALRSIREDLAQGKDIRVSDYAAVYGVTRFNNCLVVGVDKDTDDDLKKRADFIKYVQRLSGYYHYHKEQGQDIFNPDEMAVQNAIDLLKSKGYKIMKPKIEFEEV